MLENLGMTRVRTALPWTDRQPMVSSADSWRAMRKRNLDFAKRAVSVVRSAPCREASHVSSGATRGWPGDGCVNRATKRFSETRVFGVRTPRTVAGTHRGSHTPSTARRSRAVAAPWRRGSAVERALGPGRVLECQTGRGRSRDDGRPLRRPIAPGARASGAAEVRAAGRSPRLGGSDATEGRGAQRTNHDRSPRIEEGMR